MPRYRTVTLAVASALLLGACGSTPEPAPKVASLQSAPTTAATAGPGGKTVNAGNGQGTRWRLDSTDEEKIKLTEQYDNCLVQHGVKEKKSNADTILPAGQRNLDRSGEPKAAYTACAPKKPLPPVELDENANPNFAAQWEDNVRCLRAHGLKVHTTDPGSWTYDSADTSVPDNQADLERDCLLEAFGGKKK